LAGVDAAETSAELEERLHRGRGLDLERRSERERRGDEGEGVHDVPEAVTARSGGNEWDGGVVVTAVWWRRW